MSLKCVDVDVEEMYINPAVNIKTGVRPASVVSFCVELLSCIFVGYDLASEGGVKAMLDEFDQEVGLHYLRAIHLNDSKGTVTAFKISHTDSPDVTFLNSALLCQLSLFFSFWHFKEN